MFDSDEDFIQAFEFLKGTFFATNNPNIFLVKEVDLDFMSLACINFSVISQES